MASRQTAGHHQLSPLSFRCRHSSVNRIVRRRASFIIASVRFFLKSRPPSAQGREDVLPEWLGSGLAGGVVTVGHCVGLFLPAARAASPAQGLPQRRRVSAWVPADDPHGWGRQKVEWIEARERWEAASPAGAPSTATAWGFSCLRRGLPRRHRGCRSGAFPRGCLHSTANLDKEI